MDHVPDYYVIHDYTREPKTRIIMCSSFAQREIFSQVEEKYVDGTFEYPFKRLYIIHTFIRNEDGTAMKLVPLCFILMTTRKTLRSAITLQFDILSKIIFESHILLLKINLKNIISNIFVFRFFDFPKCISFLYYTVIFFR